MIQRIVIALIIAVLAIASFAPTIHLFAQFCAQLPAISDVSLCFAFDTPEKRTWFTVESLCIIGAGFGLLTFVALSLTALIQRRLSTPAM
jgi:hypothetical protein